MTGLPNVISNDKAAHMLGVAEYMYAHAAEYGLDPHKMFLCGYLHDVGMVYDRPDMHEGLGADLLIKTFDVNKDNEIINAIRHHRVTPEIYISLYGQPTKEQILLWEGDAVIDYKGNYVGFEGRLNDIASRYGEYSENYKNTKEIIDWLTRQ